MEVSTTNHILLADSDTVYRKNIAEFLSGAGHTVSQAGDGNQALDLLGDNVFQLVITELELPGLNGIDAIKIVHEQSQATPVIITTSQGSLEKAVDSMRMGAFDFREKPLNMEHLGLTVHNALEKSTLHHAYFYLRHEQPYLYRLESITAESQAMKETLRQVSRLAPTNMTVLLTGETGTGKSLVAGAIHANSPRRDGTLVTVNCAALTETLLESELFGHERGAFTGAHKARSGRFQQAHGGTLFLDEVGEMSPAVQAKVLRAIEEQAIYRLGGSREIHVNVRILAATNRDLKAAVDRGEFRKDLFYRLNVATLNIAPLREREDDILPLARRFMNNMCGEMNRACVDFSQGAQGSLINYPWPGNIRELRNVVEKAVLFSDGAAIERNDLGLNSSTSPGVTLAAGPGEGGGHEFSGETLSLVELERQAIIAALEKSTWVQKEAAKLLGITDRQMTYKLNKLGIENPRFRARRRRG